MSIPNISPVIVGVTGYKQSGKDTVVKQLHIPLLVNGRYTTIFRFADGIYEGVAKEFEVTVEHLRGVKTNLLVRHVLQYYGTEIGRVEHGEDIWIKELERRMKVWLERCSYPTNKTIYAVTYAVGARPLIFIPDCRFKNEAEWIRSKGGCIIRVEREGQVNDDTHPSETDIDHIHPDWFIRNDGVTLTALARDCRFIAQHIVERYKL